MRRKGKIFGMTSVLFYDFIIYMHSKEYYINLRNNYLPEKVKVLFIFESPPAAGHYFYADTGSERLFDAMMEAIGYKPKNKIEGLKTFQGQGYFLIDSTYVPVNEMTNKERRTQVLNDIDILKEEIRKYVVPNETKIILVMSRLYDAIADKLIKDGVKIENQGDKIPYPYNNQRRKEFIAKIKKYL